MTTFTVRQVEGEEIRTTAFPLGRYSFGSTPAPVDETEEQNRLQAMRHRMMLVGFEDDEPVVTGAHIPLTQAIRGHVVRTSGIASVASHPMARRKGYVRQMLVDMFARTRDEGFAYSGLYPFRESFYGRLGFATFPQVKITSFNPATVAALSRQDFGGTVWRTTTAEHPDVWTALARRIQPTTHGMALFPDAMVAERTQENPYWLAVAEVDGTVVGVMVYKIKGYGDKMEAPVFLYSEPAGLYLLLGWIGRHVDQVSTVEIDLAPTEQPETWHPDMDVKIRTTDWVTPMGRVLDVAAMGGIGVGEGRFTAQITDEHCPWNNGVFTFDGAGGALTVTHGGTPDCRLTIQGLSALAFGTHPPQTFALRGWGDPSPEMQATLHAMFPPMQPFMYVGY